jgi:hypothetical protein
VSDEKTSPPHPIFRQKREIPEPANHRKILKSTVRITIARKATPVYHRLNVRKKTMAAIIAAGMSIQIMRRINTMIAIPIITRAMNPSKEMMSTTVT